MSGDPTAMDDPCIKQAITAVANSVRKEACQRAGLLSRAQGIELDVKQMTAWLWGEEARLDFISRITPIIAAGMKNEDVDGMWHQLVSDWSARLLQREVRK
jgi:hypothetical protein